MIPIKDYNPTRRKARVVPAILIFNVIVFLWELGLGSDRTAAVYYFGVVPRFFTDPALREQLGALHLIQSLFTTLFMHGGWFHLLANMWTLFVFGDNVEDRLGVSRFILLYFLAGMAASGLEILVNPHSETPIIGASGAIAGVMGAYLRLYPKARIDMLIPPLVFGPFFRIPAYVFLLYWIVLQLFNGSMSLGHVGGGGVAWWAHVGGFATGFLLCTLLTPPQDHPDTYRSPSGRVRYARR